MLGNIIVSVGGWLHQHHDAVEAAHYVVIAGAALVAGWWAIMRLSRERTDEAALDLAIDTSVKDLGSEKLAVIAVNLANRGKTKIQAKTAKDASGRVFDDGIEQLVHSCSLQVRRVVATNLGGQGAWLDWFEKQFQRDVPGIPPSINLLADYEDPRHGNVVDFWMEPNETYYLTAQLVLPPGVYLGKVTFIAAGNDENFWSRVFCFEVK